MKKLERGTYSSKLDAFKEYEVTQKNQEVLKGGFTFRMLDDIRCSIDRSFSLFGSGGGNGDGDW